MNVGDVAARTISRALAGRSLYIPGVANQVLRHLGGMVPPQVVAYIIDKRWRSSHEKAYASVSVMTSLPSANYV